MTQNLMRTLIRSILVFIVLTVLLGLIYPFVTTQVASLIFPEQAQGSLIKDGQGNVVGSKLIGQDFSNTPYFKSRPSVSDYNGLASGGTNLSTTNPKLNADIEARRHYWLSERFSVGADYVPVPYDLLTSSGSGLDPDISMDAALFQLPIVAKKNNLDRETLLKVINELEHQSFINDTPYVNVLELNLAVKALTQGKNIDEALTLVKNAGTSVAPNLDAPKAATEATTDAPAPANAPASATNAVNVANANAEANVVSVNGADASAAKAADTAANAAGNADAAKADSAAAANADGAAAAAEGEGNVPAAKHDPADVPTAQEVLTDKNKDPIAEQAAYEEAQAQKAKAQK